ncbi:hypothetical protein KTQ74_05945 [Pseudomonas chlororaphis]|uniref:hypothetical protein n=1 Tax=Pseudomonas TaxID=286 RepID=UPI0012E097E0|nr:MULTISPECIES: hypothetical protein [Pseudomonas]MCB2251432.1 hypothetical protein [Pseudomonas chlororaphis]
MTGGRLVGGLNLSAACLAGIQNSLKRYGAFSLNGRAVDLMLSFMVAGRLFPGARGARRAAVRLGGNGAGRHPAGYFRARFVTMRGSLCWPLQSAKGIF